MTPRLRRCVAAASLALGLQAHANDCPPEPPPPGAAEIARAAAQARDRGFLWRIDKGGRSSWLYGTIHLGRLEWTFPGPKVREALLSSDVAAFELDFTDPALMQRLQGALTTAARESAALPDDLAARLRERLKAACAPPELAQALPPELLGATLMLMSTRRDGLDVGHAIDPALAQLARQEGKPVLSLETPEQQVALLRSDTPAELRQSLEKVLRDLEQDRARPLLLRVAEVWEHGRADELARYRNWCDCARTPQERRALKALLDDRNGPMAERIDALHAGGRTVFAAVGSLHLVGPSSLPSLLAARGYRVTRIALQR
ncbi:MAG TPA: TraB/GumN family protein [Rhizobacter sp.]